MNFGEAIALLKVGELVQRDGWNGKGMWLALQRPETGSKMSLPYIYMSTVKGELVPWLASQTDMLSEDWRVYGTSAGVQTYQSDAVMVSDRKLIAAGEAQKPNQVPDPGERMLQFFQFGHLRPDLQRYSQPFCQLAHWIATELPVNLERTVALRKLLEAKDAGVRATIYKG